jgi:hypothetical protein
MDVCCENSTESRKKLCEKIHNFSVQCGGTCSNHYALNGLLPRQTANPTNRSE